MWLRAGSPDLPITRPSSPSSRQPEPAGQRFAARGFVGALSREYFVANTLFYGFLFVGILFFWNWFNLHSPAFTAVGDETVSLVWILVDAILPLVTGAMGMHLVRGTRGGG